MTTATVPLPRWRVVDLGAGVPDPAKRYFVELLDRGGAVALLLKPAFPTVEAARAAIQEALELQVDARRVEVP